MESTNYIKEKLREKANDVVEYLSKSFYVNINDMDINGKKYNSFVLLSLASVIADKSLLVRGNYGFGKTTTAEALDSLIYQNPLEISSQSMIRANPELMREDIIGYLNIPKLTKEGKEEITWSLFVKKYGTKIVDEFNRMPEIKQTLLLDGIERGIFAYKNQIYNIKKQPFIATINYKDGGNYELNPAILDRFDISLNVFPTPYIEYISGDINYELLPDEIKTKLDNLKREYEDKILKVDDENRIKELMTEYKKKKVEILGVPYSSSMLKEKLSAPEISVDMYQIYMENNDEKIIRDKIKELKNIYSSLLDDRGVPHLRSVEKDKIKTIASMMEMSKDAKLFFYGLYKEINASYKDPTTNKEIESRYRESPLYMVKNNISTRITRYIDVAKVVAFITGKEEVDIEIVEKTIPYALAHRIKLNETIEAEIKDDLKTITKKDYTHSITEEFLDRYKEYFIKNLEQFEELEKSIILEDKETLDKITIPSKHIYLE